LKVNSPRIEKIEVMRHGQVRRAQLYFLRDRVGRAATLRERRVRGPIVNPAAPSATAGAGTATGTPRSATRKKASTAKTAKS